jgi:hypothetical protein
LAAAVTVLAMVRQPEAVREQVLLFLQLHHLAEVAAVQQLLIFQMVLLVVQVVAVRLLHQVYLVEQELLIKVMVEAGQMEMVWVVAVAQVLLGTQEVLLLHKGVTVAQV